MINSDKAHLYHVLKHYRDKVLMEKQILQFRTTDSSRINPITGEILEMKHSILDDILCETDRFKELMILEMEVSSICTFDEMLKRLDSKSSEWNAALALKRDLNLRTIVS